MTLLLTWDVVATAQESTEELNLTSQTLPRVTMKSNSTVHYFDTPGEVDTFGALFSEGKFYGRLRSNTFYFWWDKEDPKHDINLISGLGGSVVYKSAVYSGFDMGAGLYYSHGFFDEKTDPALRFKAGKDAFSRYEFLKTGSKDMAVLGQAYLRYSFAYGSSVKAGRQLVEGFYTKSNDTKMIPNTFDGLVFKTEVIPKTKVQLNYLVAQKLRDHTQAHAVLTYGDCASDGCFDSTDTMQQSIAALSENDDSAMHKGLTYTALKAAGKPTDAPLITGDLHNSTLKGLKADLSFYVVPELLSQVMGELNYKIDLGTFSLTPGIRYIRQFDNGAGSVGGASIKGDADASTYTDPTSLDSQMIAVRLVTRFDHYKLNLAYTNILDEADLVTPWRGFPTAGYTRSMARYNWRANTKSYRAELVRSLSGEGLYNDLYLQTSVMYEDDDEKKTILHTGDSLYYYLGLMQNVAALDNMQWRFRVGFQQYLDSSTKLYNDGTTVISYKDTDLNNLDTRFEINYFF